MPIHRLDPSSPAFRDDFAFGARRRLFDATVTGFLNELSRSILSDPRARAFPDLATFAYFCRRASLSALAERHPDARQRLGWGTLVHVAPSNIPINFAFSLVFGMLAGNSNIVRLPSRGFPQIDLCIELFDRTLADARFGDLARETALVQAERGNPAFNALIAEADGVVVWGGDATVNSFRALPKKPRAVEVYFPDRRSSAAIDAAACLALDADGLRRLAHDFFNDSYLVDQNACSSPSLVFWVGAPATTAAAKNAFWAAVSDELQRQNYRLDPTARIDKHLDLLALTADAGHAVTLTVHAPDIWCLDGSAPTTPPLRFGQFVEIDLEDMSGIAGHLRDNEQTLTVFGLSSGDLLDELVRAGGHAVDRIVPIGRALDIGPYWDGKDLIATLSRRIEVA